MSFPPVFSSVKWVEQKVVGRIKLIHQQLRTIFYTEQEFKKLIIQGEFGNHSIGNVAPVKFLSIHNQVCILDNKINHSFQPFHQVLFLHPPWDNPKLLSISKYAGFFVTM